ncbi:TIR-only protein-like [Eucalyptus grandis]|uniref:TIR-only protein-like n=1 Tax=Eucalyptus grandis TaxID=71139 RepID=UPI00192EB3F5|nr:TIR-only protein-like [Eucalyptus grandis]
MAISATGMSTGNLLRAEYQVFLSFRGLDNNRGFADTLYQALSEAWIRVCINYKEIRPGERIDGKFLQAINDPRLYIPIFSPSYASSYRCLCELAKMVENISNSREDANNKVILPIFYNVKPYDVELRTPCTKMTFRIWSK